MDIDVRPFSGDPRGFYDAAERAFGEWSRDDDYARWQHTFEADRAVAAYDADAVVGTAGILTFDMTVPGGVLPATLPNAVAKRSIKLPARSASGST